MHLYYALILYELEHVGYVSFSFCVDKTMDSKPPRQEGNDERRLKSRLFQIVSADIMLMRSWAKLPVSASF